MRTGFSSWINNQPHIPLSGQRLAFIFPAFSGHYENHPGTDIPGFSERFGEYLQAASPVEPRLTLFDFRENAFLEDELLTQYVTFVYSCAMSSLLRGAGIFPAFAAGYSMGIYSALCESGAISYRTGLIMIREAYRSMEETLDGRNYGMGAVIGLERSDIAMLLDKHGLEAAITNQNAAHAFVVTGKRGAVLRLLSLAAEEGALHTRELGVTIPYHSYHLEPASRSLAGKLEAMEISRPEFPILSLVDQTELSTETMIRSEVIRNLYRSLNWAQSMQYLVESGITGFIECGPGTGLSRNARFAEGVRFLPPASFFS